MGAATWPPLPPRSTSTTTTTCGSSAGAKEANQAWSCPLAAIALGDALRGARLARDRTPGMRAAAPVPPSLTTPTSALRRKAHTTGERSTCPVILLDGRVGERAVGALDALDQPRLPEDAAVGDGRHHPRHLHRRHQHAALSDGDVDRVARLPAAAVAARAAGRATGSARASRRRGRCRAARRARTRARSGRSPPGRP